jgi:hypothetical protein
MIAYLGAGLLLGGFLVCFKVLKVAEATEEILRLSKRVAQTVAAPAETLDDDQKELQLQEQSKALFKLFGAVSLGVGAALGLPFLALLALQQASLVRVDATVEVLTSWTFLLISTTLLCATWVLSRRRKR